MNTKITGGEGKKIAIDYLTEHNYKIVATNFRYSYYEIDIIAEKEYELVFVEVKYRKKVYKDFDIELAITNKKKRNIYTASKYFLDVNKKYKQYYSSYDVILIEEIKGEKNIKHYRKAFIL